MQEASSLRLPRSWPTVVARGAAVLAALAAPLLIAWYGIHVLALHLESLQPDGDLEPGGNFALLWLAGLMLLLNYLGSGLVALAMYAWQGGRPMVLLATVVASSSAITLLLVALNWG
ncbi:MAG TPA: hypothetical protein VFL59_07590 [Candidatus Nanopelagicales bacterium]|nr:hypothetical protein [Candidatus Nanopelagicales bacterium]